MVDLPPLPEISPIPIETQPILVVDFSQNDSQASKDMNGSSTNYDLVLNNSQTIWADSSLAKEEKIWLLAKKIGVNGNDKEQFFIEKIKEMEARDKEASKKSVNLNGSE